MDFRLVAFAVATVVALNLSTTADAATLSSSGATGVEVQDTFYDVTFTDGTCAALFDGCDASSDFTFTTFDAAIAASRSLFDLFNAPGNEAFTSQPTLTEGCSDPLGCLIVTPFALLPSGSVQSVYFGNDAIAGFDVTGNLFINPENDFANISSWTYAIWSPIAPVPLPAGLPLILTGFAGLAGLRMLKGRTT